MSPKAKSGSTRNWSSDPCSVHEESPLSIDTAAMRDDMTYELRGDNGEVKVKGGQSVEAETPAPTDPAQ